MMKNRLLNVLFILGIVVSAYLTYAHYNPGVLVCPKGKVIDCAAVITSQYSVVFGIPLAVYSVIWFIIALLFVRSGKLGVIADIWILVGVGGILYSVFSMYALSRICIYCATLDVLIALSVFVYFKYPR